MNRELTLEEQSTNFQTLLHIIEVQRRLLNAVAELQRRCLTHDQSKLSDPELSTFTEFTPKLKTAQYGSAEYKQFLADMKPALDHHYAHNRHHPEHYADGVNEMDLIDVLEMLSDWIASTKRTQNGNIYRSMKINAERFNLSPQLVRIMLNTVLVLDPDLNHDPDFDNN